MRSMIVGLGVLALIAAASTVSAKDLPRARSEPAKATARGCEYLGPGYVKAEGSDTCVKVSGSMRVEGSFTSGR